MGLGWSFPQLCLCVCVCVCVCLCVCVCVFVCVLVPVHEAQKEDNKLGCDWIAIVHPVSAIHIWNVLETKSD